MGGIKVFIGGAPAGTIDYNTGALVLSYPVGDPPDAGPITVRYRKPFVPLRHALLDAKGKPGEVLSDADSTDFEGLINGLWKQFVSEPLQAGTITISDTVTSFLQARSADFSGSALWAGIVSNDGSVLRGEILARAHYGTNTEFIDFVPVFAFGTLTFTIDPDDGDTVVVDGRTYTFKTTITGGNNVADNVLLVDLDIESSIDNLVAAMTLGAGAGVTYAAATVTAHPTVTVVKASTTTMTATALTDGVAGNSITTTATFLGSWGSSTLLGGLDAVNENNQWSSSESAQNAITVLSGDRLVVEVGFTEIAD